ncbi:MAG: SRPBCC domain-containing protein [Ignavibacteria bacterium]|nr:SRPBCC domain-containing protein [Ignavibacteria bacterium]
MKDCKLKYSISINAPAETVWEKMTGAETYKTWVNESWPGSYYEGEWKEGTEIKFLSPNGGGTLAELRSCTPNKNVELHHTAVINPDGSEDRDSEMAKNWIGSLEKYSLNESDGKTELTVEMKTSPEWEKMFNEGWPAALNKLKEISEN